MPSIDRHRSREICLAHFRAREAFWARAQLERVEPTEPPYRVHANATTDLRGLPSRFTLWGVDPGVWPREWPEWRAWKRARDKAVAGNLGLIGIIMSRAGIDDRDRMYDAAHSCAARGIMRGIDLWDPHRENAPSTYFGRWIAQGIQQARKQWARYERLPSAAREIYGDGTLLDGEISDDLDPCAVRDLLIERWQKMEPCNPSDPGDVVYTIDDLAVWTDGTVVYGGMCRK